MKTMAISLFAMLCASTAAAQTSYSVVGAGCVPTGQTSAAQTHFDTAGDVAFAAGKVGEIIVTCPVPQSLISATKLSVTFRDTDGRDAAARVSASLRQKDLLTARASNVGTAKVDSNLQDATSSYASMTANIGTSGCGEFTFDHSRFAYYVQVNLKRTNASAQAILASVRLWTPEC